MFGKLINDNKIEVKNIQNSNRSDARKKELIDSKIKKHARLKDAQNKEKINKLLNK